MPLSIVYVCDEAHAARLVISLESWKRFMFARAYVVDFGFSRSTRRQISNVYDVTVLERSRPMASHVPRRLGAYREKALAGMRIAQADPAHVNPILLLDSDILVVDASFFHMIGDVGDRELAAAPSAWDVDFTWTYQPQAQAVIRGICGAPDFALTWTIPNSGVVLARPRTWCAISPVWSALYDRFLATPDWQKLIRPRASPGDQEFLRLAFEPAGCVWRRIHGSYNMQVSPDRMYWGSETQPPFLGGHFDELPEIVRAVHYGVDPDGALRLSGGMLANGSARACLAAMVDELRRSAVDRGWAFMGSGDA